MEGPILAETRPRAPMRRMGAVSVLAAVCGAAAFLSTQGRGAAKAALNAVESATASSSSDSVVIKAYASAMSPDCRRHALDLDKYMLSDSGIIDAVEVEVDFFGGQREVDSYGRPGRRRRRGAGPRCGSGGRSAASSGRGCRT